MDTRYHRVEWGQRKTETTEASVGNRSRTAPSNWKQPIKWNKDAAAAGTRPRVFCASLADVFDNQVSPAWREDLFELIRVTPNLVWLLLTKRPQNIVKMVHASGAIAGNGTRYLPGNAALGTTIEDQLRADINVPALLNAKVQCGPLFVFVSCEPLLGPIDLTRVSFGDGDPRHKRDALSGQARMYCTGSDGNSDFTVLTKLETPMARIDWVIAGGETDQGKHKARPPHPDWLRSLRDQCAAAGTEFHFKQWGDYAPIEAYPGDPNGKFQTLLVNPDGKRLSDADAVMSDFSDSARYLYRVGKSKAGRLLDGVEHNGFPERA